MVRPRPLLTLCIVLAGAIMSGCAQVPGAIEESDVEAILLTGGEAAEAGWIATPDEGPVDGGTPDCAGNPAEWSDLRTVEHASQFLDRTDQTLLVIVRERDGAADADVDALRVALRPCAPSSGELRHGAMVTPAGDDSMAYQTTGSDDRGQYIFSVMLLACGDFSLEMIGMDYSGQLRQAEFEKLLAPAVKRLAAAGDCAS